MAAAILVASVLIDLDHVPGELGTDILTAGTPRPYTHSLATLVVLLGVAAATRSQVMLGAAIGVAGHLARDVGTGDGVSLLWPLTDAEASVSFLVYVCVLALTAARAAARPTARRRPPR